MNDTVLFFYMAVLCFRPALRVPNMNAIKRLNTKARRIGRPDAQATEDLSRRVLSTATHLFIEQGYAATSMEQIAAAASAGKQTIYRRYASKEELFTAALMEMTRIIVEARSGHGEENPDPLAALREDCWAALELISRPMPVAMYRILIAESLRFPALVERVMQVMIGPFEDVFRRHLEAARKAGQLQVNCPLEVMLHGLTGLFSGWFLQQRLLGQRALETEAERAAFFDTVWALFLKGAAP